MVPRMRPFLVLAALVCLSACRADAPGGRPPGDGGLSDRIASAVREGALVDLEALAPSAWTRVCAFSPYTTQAMAEQVLGFAWPYAWGNIEHLDDFSFVVLVDDRRADGEQVVAALEQPRNRGDFAGLDSPCVPRDRARFTVRRDGDLASGAAHLVLRPSP